MTNRERVLAAIQAGHETIDAICAETGLSKNEVWGARDNLMHRGIIERYKAGESDGTQRRPPCFYREKKPASLAPQVIL